MIVCTEGVGGASQHPARTKVADTMKLRNRFLMLASVSALAGTAACNTAPPPPARAQAPKQTGVTFSAKASATSQSTLGITRWHSTVERGANAALILDGQDRVGRVKYLSMAFIDHHTNMMHVQVLLPQKGEVVWDVANHEVVSNTLPQSAHLFAKGIYHDYLIAHPLHGAMQAYDALQRAVGYAAPLAIARCPSTS
jgi:hypothetical protein